VLSRFTALDACGIRRAMAISTIVATIVYFGYFKAGRWKLKKV